MEFKEQRIRLGAFLRERREELNLPAAILAATVEVHEETILQIEAGEFLMDIDLQFSIYRVLGIKPYFSFINQPDEEDYMLRRDDDPEHYHGFYISENLMLYPDQLAIVKLTYPRLFVRFNYADSLFIDYEDWKNNIVKMQWLDSDDKPVDEDEIDSHLTDCWNFLALHEREEENLFGDEDFEEI